MEGLFDGVSRVKCPPVDSKSQSYPTPDQTFATAWNLKLKSPFTKLRSYYYFPRLCRIPSYFCPNEVLETLCPSKISPTVLFSKPILLAGSKLAQIWAESQFSPDFGHTNPSATRCYLAGKLKDLRPTPPASGEPEERRRPHGHPSPGMIRNPGSHFDQAVDWPGCGRGMIAARYLQS